MNPTPWPHEAAHALQVNSSAWLVPTPAYLAGWLNRPELALVEESCAAERKLHQSLRDDPLQAVAPDRLARLKDKDARENYAHFLALRDGLHQAGTLQAWLLKLYRQGNQNTPPLFIDLVVQAVLQHLLQSQDADAFTWRAAEMLFREQRVSEHEGRVLAGDRSTLDLQRETHGFGDLGRLLAQAQQPLKAVQMQVLTSDNAPAYFAEGAKPRRGAMAQHRFLLDLTHQLKQELGHGLVFHLTAAHSGLVALAEVLRLWTQHFLGVAVTITPLQSIDDPQWRWHLGLDAESSALLNDLYTEAPVSKERQARLISLFQLDFENPGDAHASLAGRPVYLGLAVNAHKSLRIKPQNLLLNLPLATSN